MRIAVIDDDCKWLAKTSKIIKNYYNNLNVIIDTYSSGNDFIESKKYYDVALVDLEMPDLNGFDTIMQYKTIYSDCITIILTTHTELSRKGYIVDAFRYIDKTSIDEELNEALTAVERLQSLKEKITLNILSIGEKQFVISDIIYVETEKRNIRVHVSDNSFVCTESLEYLENLLSTKGFFRSHKSYLVNLNAIRSFDRKDICFANGEKAMVSIRKYAALKKNYLEYKFECASF